MITIAKYFMGRDKLYPRDLTEEIQGNAALTVLRVNKLLTAYKSATGLDVTIVNSGWRPPAVNANTANAAKKSHHMMGRAVDLGDDAEYLDTWLMTVEGQSAMSEAGVWHEHPSATPRWAHLQTVAPRSGKRTFMP